MNAADSGLSHEKIIDEVRDWIQVFVIDLNLCPFAGRELAADRIRFVVSKATDEHRLLTDLQAEFAWLDENPQVETTLLIHPSVLGDFYDYNDFLDQADRQIDEDARQGVYQVASFHPNYRFEGTAPDDAENFTNRSPYPMLHILREASLENAIAHHPDTNEIPARNIALLRSLGVEQIRAIISQTRKDNSRDNPVGRD